MRVSTSTTFSLTYLPSMPETRGTYIVSKKMHSQDNVSPLQVHFNDPVALVFNWTLQHTVEVMHNPTKSTQLMNFKCLNHRAAFK